MGAALLLARKDLIILFRSPLAWLVMAGFLFMTGFFFFSGYQLFVEFGLQIMQNPQAVDLTVQDFLVTPYLQNTAVVLLFLLPLITMRSFSEEKKSGTFEMLMSLPLREYQIAGGKLFAMGVFLLITLLLNFVGPLLLFFFTDPEAGAMAVGFLGVFLFALGLSSLGLFISSLFENQVVAAMFTFILSLVLWLMNWMVEAVPEGAQPFIEGISLLGRFQSFTEGVLRFDDVLYYLSFTAAFFWLTVLSLENQRRRS